MSTSDRLLPLAGIDEAFLAPASSFPARPLRPRHFPSSLRVRCCRPLAGSRWPGSGQFYIRSPSISQREPHRSGGQHMRSVADSNRTRASGTSIQKSTARHELCPKWKARLMIERQNRAQWFESYQLPLLPFFAAFICMVAGPLPAFAQQAPEADPYNAGRKIVADIGKIVTPNGVQETFEMHSRRCPPGSERPWIEIATTRC